MKVPRVNSRSLDLGPFERAQGPAVREGRGVLPAAGVLGALALVHNRHPRVLVFRDLKFVDALHWGSDCGQSLHAQDRVEAAQDYNSVGLFIDRLEQDPFFPQPKLEEVYLRAHLCIDMYVRRQF